MEFIKEILKKEITRRIIIFSALGILLYLMKGMINIFLLTFIFTYLLYSIQGFLIIKLKKIVRIRQKVMIVILYVVLIAFIIFFLCKYIPVLVYQSNLIIQQAMEIYKNPQGNPIAEYIVTALNELDISVYINKGVGFLFKSLTDISRIGFDLFFSLVLSLFFLLEKGRIINFTSGFKNSKIAVVYNEVQYFGSKFLQSFGKVIQAQVLIALTNAVLSVIALWIMGFPYLPFLGTMIFVLGLVPVAGVLISLIPLSILAFSIGGVMKVVYVLIMIAALHALESYILNPKLMSHKTNLPVFYTFLVLLISEHVIGIWGMIIGIPIFIFILDVLNVNREPANKIAESNTVKLEEDV